MMGWLRRLLNSATKAATPSGAVSADRGGVAVGRDIRDSTINVGADEEEIQLRITQAHGPLIDRINILAEQVSREKGIPIGPIQAVLAKFGEVRVPDHEILTRLNIVTDQYLELRELLTRASTERPEFLALRQRVLELLDGGDLDGARSLLREGRQRARSLSLAREEVETVATEGRIDALQLNHRAAAMKYAEAAVLVATFDPEGVWGLVMEQADALFAQGSEFGEADALRDAIALYKRCLTLAPRSKRPLDWSTTQNALGVALSSLGEREEATVSLKEAVEAFSEALKEAPRERSPFDWARTKNNLGNVLTTLGERENNPASLEAALVAYEEALEVSTRERTPLDWANTQSNMGTTLQILGKREVGTERLLQSVSHYQAALTERTRERVPLDWAMTQNNLGNTLSLLSELERSVVRLQASIECFVEALKERVIDRVPLDWAMTTSNLGMSLVRIGSLDLNVKIIEAGRDAISAALEVFEQLGAERFVSGNKRNLTTAEMVLAAARSEQE